MRSAVLWLLRVLRRITGWGFLVVMGSLLALFGLQFTHAAKFDTLWVVVQIRRWGDPFLTAMGSWVSVAWPATPSWSFLPLVIALGAWGLKVGVDAAFQWLQTVLRRKKAREKPNPRVSMLTRGPLDSKRSREELLRRYRELESALRSSQRKRCAFLSVDVVGSTRMKQGEEETDIAATFQAYEELLNRIFEEHGAWKVSWTSDGVMVCFLQLDLAVAAGQEVLKSLEGFNAVENKLRTPFRVRTGVNEGEVAIFEDTRLEKAADRVIDVAGQMQKHARPNALWLAENMYNSLRDRSGFRPTGEAVDDVQVYEWTPDAPRGQGRGSEATVTGGIERTLTASGRPGTAWAAPPEDGKAQRIGRYEVLGELGRGAMGVVYKAHDPQIGRTVAIKMIIMSNQNPAEIEQYKPRFFREAQTAGQLSHPGIVTIYDVNEDSYGQPYLVMEYVEGTTLDKLLAPEVVGESAPRRPLRESLNIAAQVADALDFAHRHNVIHRDIKPANILVTTEGKAKITDFGIAKQLGTHMTHTRLLVGTPAFMSPEQITGAPVDSRSDIFSLGVVLYWMFTGRKPFEGQAITEVAYKVVHGLPTPIRQLNSELPSDLELIIARCLAKTPEERYQTARNLTLDLDALKAKQPVPVEPLPDSPAFLA